MLRKPIHLQAFLMACVVSLFAVAQAHAQCKPPANQKPPLSPAEQASIELGGKNVTIYYCAPSLKGRTVGDQVATFDKVWRTGANTSTTLHTDANLNIRGKVVPAGTYSLYTIPSRRGWVLIINKQTGQWGTVYNQQDDLYRIPMLDGIVASTPVEKFTIHFDNTKGNKTELHLSWGKANVLVPVEATTM
jgi:Protein of unknown function (DUF2911)